LLSIWIIINEHTFKKVSLSILDLPHIGLKEQKLFIIGKNEFKDIKIINKNSKSILSKINSFLTDINLKEWKK